MPSSKGKPTQPQLREEAIEHVKQSGEGGAPGQWTANKAGRMAQEYEKRGGDYENEDTSKNKPEKGPPQRKEKKDTVEEDEDEEEDEQGEAEEDDEHRVEEEEKEEDKDAQVEKRAPGKRTRSEGDGPSRKSQKVNETEDKAAEESTESEEGNDKDEGDEQDVNSGEEEFDSSPVDSGEEESEEYDGDARSE